MTLVLRGGRVLDPETGLDAVRDVLIDGDTISAVGEGLQGDTVVDVSGLVVAPGFIDLHSHAQFLPGRRLQACDGVTTALELEAGRADLDNVYTTEAATGSPINYGYSASWASARMHVMLEVGLHDLLSRISSMGDPRWQVEATPDQVSRILAQISSDVAAGGIGVGLLSGYAPGVDPSEYTAVATLASTAGVPTFTHCRDLIEFTPDTKIDGAEEVVRSAAETGVHAHYCHINSTSTRHIDRVHALVEKGRADGGRITTEAYPYGSGSTAIGAAFLSPERLAERGLKSGSLTYLPTGERVADDARLRELRETDPGGICIVEFFDEDNETDMAVLRRSLNFPDTCVASDAMPIVPMNGDWSGFDEWPLPPHLTTHPRTAGCFSRALRLWRTEDAPLLEAVRRCSLAPAQVLEGAVPAMRKRGRVQAGCDADLVVFDADTITDQATYLESTRPSTGIAHVLVNGEFVLRDSELLLDATPGRPVRGEAR